MDDLKDKIKVAWNDPANPSMGFNYLYFDEETYSTIPEGAVIATEIADEGETRWKISDIIGEKDGIGVENLMGSGLIAGETSLAYDETFTLSYVTGRSVGIGAYICRLGQRLIQMDKGPMILTGYGALNKLLGRTVYTSQDQLGGPQVRLLPLPHAIVSNQSRRCGYHFYWLTGHVYTCRLWCPMESLISRCQTTKEALKLF